MLYEVITEAIFIKGGTVEQTFENGTYKLSTENYPFISRLRNAFTGGISTFNCVVYFVRKAHSEEILWGTDSPIHVITSYSIHYTKLYEMASSPGITIRVEFVLKSSSGCRQISNSPSPVFLITSAQCFLPPVKAVSFGFLLLKSPMIICIK